MTMRSGKFLVSVEKLIVPSMRAWPNDHAEQPCPKHRRSTCWAFNEGMAE